MKAICAGRGVYVFKDLLHEAPEKIGQIIQKTEDQTSAP
jgi:hypothetical protein